MIEFYVGPEEQLFGIHETALAKVPNLMSQLRSNGKTHLPDIEPATFSHLLLYLYTGVVGPKLPENPGAKQLHGSTADRTIIFQLYALATQHGLEELANELLDNVRANGRLVRFFPHELIWLGGEFTTSWAHAEFCAAAACIRCAPEGS